MKRYARWLALGAVGLLAAGAVVLPVACQSTPPRAWAGRVESRDQLVGGRRALGEVGDYKISNGIIHAIIHDVGNSRGFGAFGGSLIDLDLVRGDKKSAAVGGQGRDYFTEIFPALLIQAMEPEKIEVVADGSDGAAAVLRVTGRAGEFLSITRPVNELLIPNVPLEYQVDYALEPGKQYVKITVTITNRDPQKEAGFPLVIPFGFITLMGEGQRLFVPGKGGYDMRFRLEELYKQPSIPEALPGEVATHVATDGDGVSYGVAASPRGAGYMANNASYYPTAKPDSMLIPIAYSSFLGTFWGRSPAALAPGKSYSYSGYVAVGTGDVASAQRVLYGINDESGRKPTKYGTVTGRVQEKGTGLALAGITVVLQDEHGEYQSSAKTDEKGRYLAPVPPGRYRAHASDPVREVARSEGFLTVEEGGGGRIDLELGRPAHLSVLVRDAKGRPLPAKVTLEGTYAHQGPEAPYQFFYDLQVGERVRPTDYIPDGKDPGSRRYVERSFYATSGRQGTEVRPGSYRVFASRGPEYSLVSKEVSLGAGDERQVELVLEHLLPTPGWASADFHVHSVHSSDSHMLLEDRVASFAAEGVDFFSSTDHNYVADYTPTVEALRLEDWLKTTVGLELTTLEMGHFNAFPLQVDPGPVSHGSFNWFRRPPGELFAQLRCSREDDPSCVAKYKGKTVVQINHPRDTIMGYFAAFNLSAYQGDPMPPAGRFGLDQSPGSPYELKNFSFDFDAIEVFNGKRYDQMFTYRVPADPGPGPEPKVERCTLTKKVDCLPGVGEVIEQTIKVPDPSDPSKTIDRVQPVYPGVLEDFYMLTARGRRFTAVGNSDSHGPSAEAGLPRTYLRVGATADGSMRALSELAVVDALREHRAVVTNGPFVELWVNGEPVGSEVVAPDGTVTVRVRVQAAPWVDVSRVRIRRGGKDQGKESFVLEELAVAPSEELVRLEHEKTYKGLPDDSFIIVEVSGERSMWPVYLPAEFPSIPINEILANLAGPFGFEDKWGRYRPSQLGPVVPFAFTNPVWVVRTKKQGLSKARPVLPLEQAPVFRPEALPDLRRIFGALHADPE